MSRFVKLIFFIVATMLLLIAFSVTITHLSASGPGDEPPITTENEIPIDEETRPTSHFFCSIEIRDDLYQPNMFFGIVETYPADNAWPVIDTKSHTEETLGYTLIQIRGISVPFQFADRTRPLIFTERERMRFDKAMSYAWMLLKNAETIILRNPVPAGNGAVVCDVSIRLGGQDLDLAAMLIADGHARPEGNWDWGAREVIPVAQKE